MREILLTSSVLILALLVLRRAFRQKISRRVQYALWGLVLVRLLVPVSLPALDFSVLSVAEPVQEAVTARLEAPAFTAPVIPITNPQPKPQTPYPEAQEPTIPGTASRPAEIPAEEPAALELTVTEALGLVWLTGTAVMTVWLLASNLRFALKLRDRRITVKIPGCKYRVYMVESGLASPCLFGVLRPAIYLTPSAITSEASLRHVLAHEETHARHLDPLWAFLRSVCLAVYWFNPLVWIAATASKTDCELACDEGAIRRLGEEERLAYGRTLLSLIPVRRMPSNPLLSATTMSSDKKRLRDRVTRIAENRKTRKLALCAVSLLTAFACVLTFAGCSKDAADTPDSPGTPDSPSTPINETLNAPTGVERPDGPLTGAELRYFNEQYFNGNYMNICNQFLSSMYDAPEDIDLFELFYTGIGAREGMTTDELDAYEAAEGFVDCDIVKLTPAGMDEVLRVYTGLFFDDTNKVGMDNFTYLPQYGAYYHGHGDTNYRMSVEITAGERVDGLVRLYYKDTFMADGWKCVTLRETERGYQFVSNTYSEKPTVPTVYPLGEPLLTLPLREADGEIDSYAPRYGYYELGEQLTGEGKSLWVNSDHFLRSYRVKDRNSYGTIYIIDGEPEDTTTEKKKVRVIDSISGENFTLERFDDILGYSGFSIFSYHGYMEGDLIENFRSFYAFDDEDGLIHLMHVPYYNTQVFSVDLDGDGSNEMICTDLDQSAWVYYVRDGKIGGGDRIEELLQEAWPEAEDIRFTSVDPYARCLTMQALVPMTSEDGTEYYATAFRNIYFEDGKLLVYKPDKTAVDHILPGVTAPEAVLDTVWQIMNDTYLHRDDLKGANVYNWRIAGVEQCARQDIDGLSIDVYRYYGEVRVADPEYVFLSRGMMYMDEDGWVSSEYPGSDYVCFQVDEDGGQTYLMTFTDVDSWPGDEQFEKDLKARLVEEGLLTNPGSAVEAVWADMVQNDEAVTLTLETADGAGGSYPLSLAWNVSDDLTSGYAWEPVPEAQLPVTANGGMLTATNGRDTLIFYEDPSLVCWRNSSGTSVYRVTCTRKDDVSAWELFKRMRYTYDEAELHALWTGLPVIPDDGRSREDIAREWIEAYEGAHLNVTDGSHLKLSYMDIRDVGLDIWNEWEERYRAEIQAEYKEFRGAEDVFVFSYSSVFVPTSEDNWFIAGNTEEYQGDDAPEGAYQWWRCGYMYLLEDGWHCDEVGTGP